MKNTFIALLTLWLSLVSPSSLADERKFSSASDDGTPVMVLDENHWDFGDIARKGGNVSHEFLFRNEGTAPLVILRVVTSCSCVKASFSKRPVAPGDMAAICITYEPHKAEAGVFNKVVQIHTNANPPKELITLKGNSLNEPRRTKIKIDGMKIKTR